MAYNVYVACNICGAELFCITNQTVSLTRAEKAARSHGWLVTKEGGWYCKECQQKVAQAHLASKKTSGD